MAFVQFFKAICELKMRQKFLLVPESNSTGLRLSRPLYHYTNRDISAELTIWIPIMVRCQWGNLRSLPSPGLRYTVADVDGRLSGMLGLEVLKLSESASTALIYPGQLSVSVRSCPVAVHIFRDGRVTNGIGLYVCLTSFCAARALRARHLFGHGEAGIRGLGYC